MCICLSLSASSTLIFPLMFANFVKPSTVSSRLPVCGTRNWVHFCSLMVLLMLSHMPFFFLLFLFFRNGGAVMYFLVYVDDFIVTGNQSLVISQFVHTLAKKFSIKDLGDLHYFLDVEVVPINGGLFLS